MPAKFFLHLLLAAMAVAATSPAPGSTPKKQASNVYQRLWNSSPFTVKPPPPDPEDTGPGPLEDFTLASVSKVDDGWFVVLMNKKKREERIRIVPAETASAGFKVLDVKQDPSSYKNTKVQLAYKGDTGWVGYEDESLALKTAAPAPAAARNPAQRGIPPRPAGQPPTPAARPKTPTPPARPTQATPQTGASGTPARPTRVRRVPTPPQR